MSFGNPLPEETFAVGIIGVSLFTILLLISLVNLRKASKKLALIFFACIMCMCLLEFPRYIVMIIMREYKSTIAYSCHMLASCLYFMCVSIVCFMWAWLLELGKFTNILYSRYGVICVNIIVSAVALTMCVMCISSHSLMDFFESAAFVIYTSTEVLALVFYTGIVAFFGIRLLLRFRNYVSTGHGTANEEAFLFFKKALIRVSIMLIMTTLCALARFSLLLLKFISLDSSLSFHSSVFTQYGVLWFCWSDFVPRFLGSLALFVIVVAKNPAAARKTKQSGGPDTSTVSTTVDEKVPLLQDYVSEGDNMSGVNSPVRITGSPRKKGQPDIHEVPNPIGLSRVSSYNSDISRGSLFGAAAKDDFDRHAQSSPHHRVRQNTTESQASSQLESAAMQNFRKNLLMFYDDMDAEEDAIAASNDESANRAHSTDSAASSVQSDARLPPPGWQTDVGVGFFARV